MNYHNCLFASEIAIITGHNKFQKISDLILKIWERNNNEDFKLFLNSLKEEEKPEFITHEENIKNIIKNNNLNIDLNIIDKSTKNKDINEINNIKNELLKNSNNLPKEIKKSFTESINNHINTNYGIENEDCVSSLISEKYNLKIVKDNIFKKKLIFDDWVIGGKVDGITDNNEVIEIKNRMYKLFYKLRDYEKIQLQTYLFINDIKVGYLVESIKKNSKKNINIIKEDFNEIYYNDIIDKLKKFIYFYKNFLNDNLLKKKIILDVENFENDIHKILFND